jgi:hypothetical protein
MTRFFIYALLFFPFLVFSQSSNCLFSDLEEREIKKIATDLIREHIDALNTFNSDYISDEEKKDVLENVKNFYVGNFTFFDKSRHFG